MPDKIIKVLIFSIILRIYLMKSLIMVRNKNFAAKLSNQPNDLYIKLTEEGRLKDGSTSQVFISDFEMRLECEPVSDEEWSPHRMCRVPGVLGRLLCPTVIRSRDQEMFSRSQSVPGFLTVNTSHLS